MRNAFGRPSDGDERVRIPAPAFGADVGALTELVVELGDDSASWVSKIDDPVRLFSSPRHLVAVITKEQLVKYMLLIHQGTTPTPLDPDAWATLSDAEQQAIYAAYQQVNETPGVTPGNGLQPPETATTVRVADEKTITTDGPFVATKEALNGYLIYEADDADAAIALAAMIPAARLGGAVEVRPIMEW